MILVKTSNSSNTNNTNPSKKQKDNYITYATGMIMHNIRKRSDDHQDVVEMRGTSEGDAMDRRRSAP